MLLLLPFDTLWLITVWCKFSFREHVWIPWATLCVGNGIFPFQSSLMWGLKFNLIFPESLFRVTTKPLITGLLMWPSWTWDGQGGSRLALFQVIHLTFLHPAPDVGSSAFPQLPRLSDLSFSPAPHPLTLFSCCKTILRKSNKSTT